GDVIGLRRGRETAVCEAHPSAVPCRTGFDSQGACQAAGSGPPQRLTSGILSKSRGKPRFLAIGAKGNKLPSSRAVPQHRSYRDHPPEAGAGRRECMALIAVTAVLVRFGALLLALLALLSQCPGAICSRAGRGGLACLTSLISH